MSSPLRRFGIHRRRVIRYVDAAGRQTGLSYDTANKIISETYETSWTVLGYGFHWSRQQYPYGSIVPSLRVFPIVEDITRHEDLISKGTVQEVQQAFTSGVLHPFITSTTGCTLLHVGFQVLDIVISRADII
jgi:YD repeat-containing protein